METHDLALAQAAVGALDQEAGARVLTVTQLAMAMKGALEDTVGEIWVEGEVSDFKHHSPSGHFYFSLKDAQSTVRAVMYARENRSVRFKMDSGLKVVCHGRATFYNKSGQAQLIVHRMRPAGLGELALAFEQLKARLSAEGLFDAARKKPVPFLPRAVGVVTSPAGAAIRDIIKVIRTRHPTMAIVLCPVKVQGDGAAAEIAAGIDLFNRVGGVDVLIVGRGGGSMEDLWAFNEEVVARAIAASGIPVVSAVGHEVDFTIADFVADCRAATPSNAAERVVPVRADLKRQVEALAGRLVAALRRWAERGRERLAKISSRPAFARPLERVRELEQAVDEVTVALGSCVRQTVREHAARLVALAGRLEVLSPLGTLARGYALVTRAEDHAPVSDAGTLRKGDELAIRFARGGATCRVLTVDPREPPAVQRRLPFDDR